MSRKIRPTVFLKAAKILEKQLEHANEYSKGSSCCEALAATLKIKRTESCIGWDTFSDTPEYKLFKSMFCNKRSTGEYWFGMVYKETYDEYAQEWIYEPHKVNQKKRIKALYKTYKAAKRLK